MPPHVDGNSIVIRGDATGNTIVIGKGNLVGANKDQEISVEQIIALIKRIRAELPKTGLNMTKIVLIDEEFRTSQSKLEEPEPERLSVLPKLKSALEMLVLAGGASQAAQQLLPMAQKALEWAQQLLK